MGAGELVREHKRVSSRELKWVCESEMFLSDIQPCGECMGLFCDVSGSFVNVWALFSVFRALL